LSSAIVVCIALAFSATYERVEWLAAVRMGQGADAFLGTQGDPWDTQSDMLFALMGGVTGVLLMAPLQDRRSSGWTRCLELGCCFGGWWPVLEPHQQPHE
jgi:putative membrane protein